MSKKISGAYLEKRGINLAVKEKTMNSPSRVIPAFIVLAVLIALFTKFAVLDRLAAMNAAESLAASAENELAALQLANTDYEAVRAEYLKHFSAEGDSESDEEIVLVDRIELIELIEKKLMPAARIENWSAADNVLTVNLAGITLDDTADILQSLKGSPIVDFVTVYTAGTGNETAENGADVLMTIQLSDGGGGEK